MLLSIVYRDTEGLWGPWAPPRHQPQLYSLINLLLCFPFTSSEGEPKFMSFPVNRCTMRGTSCKIYYYTFSVVDEPLFPNKQQSTSPRNRTYHDKFIPIHSPTHVCFARLVCNHSNLILLLPTTPTKITRITRKYLYVV